MKYVICTNWHAASRMQALRNIVKHICTSGLIANISADHCVHAWSGSAPVWRLRAGSGGTPRKSTPTAR